MSSGRTRGPEILRSLAFPKVCLCVCVCVNVSDCFQDAEARTILANQAAYILNLRSAGSPNRRKGY